MGAGIRLDEFQYADSIGVLDLRYLGRLRLCTLRGYCSLGSEKCLGACPNPSFVDARAEFLKKWGKSGGLLIESKEKEGVGLE